MVQCRLFLALMLHLAIFAQNPSKPSQFKDHYFVNKYTHDASQIMNSINLLKVIYQYELKTYREQSNNKQFILFKEIDSNDSNIGIHILSIDGSSKEISYYLIQNLEVIKNIDNVSINSFSIKTLNSSKISQIHTILEQLDYRFSVPSNLRSSLIQGRIGYLVIWDSDDLISLRLGSAERWSLQLKQALSEFFNNISK